MPPSLLALLLQELPGWFQSLVLCSIHPTHHFQRNLPVPVFSFYSPAWGSNLVIFYCLLCPRACLPSRWLLAQCAFLFLALLLFKTPPSPRSVVLIPSLMFFLYIILFGSVISFLKKKFNWRTIALQYCAVFCHIPTWISHEYIYFPYFRINTEVKWLVQILTFNFDLLFLESLHLTTIQFCLSNYFLEVFRF